MQETYRYRYTIDTARTRIPRHTARYTFVLPSAPAQQGDDGIAKRVFPNLDDVLLDCTRSQFDQFRLIISACPDAVMKQAYPSA
jgi:hypothetical protein